MTDTLHSPENHHTSPPPGSAEDSRANGTTESGPRPGPGAEKKSKRDPFFDNAKYLAIVLVAMGHSWEPLRGDSRAAAALYMTVYTFHMPAFIIISGYFSRSFRAKPAQIKRLVTGVAVPYVIFEIAFTLFKRWADDDPNYPISLLDPWYLTWFLIALFIWRLTAPIWDIVRWPLSLALGIAVLASMTPSIGDDLDLQRVLQFLPFFVFGLSLEPKHFQWVRRRQARILAAPVFVGALAVAYWAAPRMNAAWFYRRDSAQELAAPGWAGGVMTLAMFGCSVILVACFLAWVPRRTMWFTALGAGTLYGYLLHGFVAKGSRFWGWYDHDWLHQPLGEVGVTLIAASLITVLCTPPVQRILRIAMEPKMEWAFRPEVPEPIAARNTVRR
ncbi:acyltransferase family protein [Streptomyces yatensis]|uniref:acyltransferase family protein n=1 Tax=Streptomyces yatensis TaxID=155177 RepID=UPI001B3C58C8|nr:acyltransferase family protein [Streptomyces yatensis]